MRRGARHQFLFSGLDQREQLWAGGPLGRSAGSDSVFERWKCGDLSCERDAGAIGKLEEVATGAESPRFCIARNRSAGSAAPPKTLDREAHRQLGRGERTAGSSSLRFSE